MLNHSSVTMGYMQTSLKNMFKKLLILLQHSCSLLVKLPGDVASKVLLLTSLSYPKATLFLYAPLELLRSLAEKAQLSQEFHADLLSILFRDWVSIAFLFIQQSRIVSLPTHTSQMLPAAPVIPRPYSPSMNCFSSCLTLA